MAALKLLSASTEPRFPGLDTILEDLRKELSLTSQDAALAREIAWGVTRNRIWLEKIVAQFLHRPLHDRAIHVQESLLMGAYQALFLDRVPVHSIVDETVRLVRSARTEEGYAKLSNAVMRRIVEAPRESLLPNETTNWPQRLSIPDWIASEAGQVFPKGEAEAFFQASNQTAPLHLRLTPTGKKIGLDELILRLRGEIVDVTHAVPEIEKGHYTDECIRIHARGLMPDALPLFRRGFVTVEDEGAQVAGWLTGAREGMTILDLCASPGGKTAHLMSLCENRAAKFIASDVSESKLARLRSTLDRLDLTQQVELKLAAEITAADYSDTFDLVLVDAPCSGLGTLRRHPEIRWRRTAKDLKNYAKTQLELLERSAPLVKSGGHLVYSLCTFSTIESDRVVESFLKSQDGKFELADAPEGLPFDDAPLKAGEGRWRTKTHLDGCDGFFVCRMRRR